MTIDALMQKPLPKIPDDIAEKLTKPCGISLTAFQDKNQILENPALQREVGYGKTENGSYLVSMTCPMPEITADEILWWFWWHPQSSVRYKVWFPGAHFSVGYAKKDAAYFEQPLCPAFQANTQYPTERIGKACLPLQIEFVLPEDFGYSQALMQRNDIPLIICGHVSACRGLVPHTEMAHIFKKTDNGLFLISRFWMGETLKNPLLRKLILTDDTAKGMAEHCCVEYRNLVEILPSLYNVHK